MEFKLFINDKTVDLQVQDVVLEKEISSRAMSPLTLCPRVPSMIIYKIKAQPQVIESV